MEQLSEMYPTINKAATEIINLQAIVNLPKGTEHFLSDIHGEYEAFSHVLKNGSGAVRKKIEDVFGKDSEQIKEEITELIRKSNVIRIVIEKNGKIIMNIPITAGVVGVVFAPILTLIGLSASVLAKYRIKIENEDEGTIVDLGEFSEEKLNIIKDMISSTAKDVKEAVDKKNKNTEDKNESDNDDVIINLNKDDYREKKDEE